MSAETRHPFERPKGEEDGAPPKIRVQFFYASPLAIDDPLSPVPTPISSSSKPAIEPPRPFSQYDNQRLEQAWQRLQVNLKTYETEKLKEQQCVAAEEAKKARLQTDLDRQRSGRRSSNTSTSRPRQSSLFERSRERSLVSREHTFPSSSLRYESPRRSSVSSNSEIEVIDHPADSELRTEYEENAEGITGKPFIRAPSRKKIPQFRPSSSQSNRDRANSLPARPPVVPAEAPKKAELKPPTETELVGVSRLHQVTMPDLSMGPTYWRPVNDTAQCIRATWFYKDSMLPIETEVAIMLEAGYLKLRPWTQTWKDELRSAIEAGPSGEEKVAHALWPIEVTNPNMNSRPTSALGSIRGSVMTGAEEDTLERRRATAANQAKAFIDASHRGDAGDSKAAGEAIFGSDGKARHYQNAQVIYGADGKSAHILPPKLQPSEYYNRRPLGTFIDKGRSIGIPIVRGFDQKSWDAANPSHKSSTAAKAEAGATAAPSARPSASRFKSSASAFNFAEPPMPTDLILVIHGIGQKLSERVESFNFTHAINTFRRDVNVELGSSQVRSHLRPGMGSIMILPINWRAALKFEEQEAGDDSDDKATEQMLYTLPDITPSTLPSVRSLVSDVLLDIPYYLSHHQPKMIAAVTKEANRVYRLWCQNNPGFEQSGRVHVIGHSLGSVMAIDILSKQPTYVKDLDMKKDQPDDTHFAFDTENLFLAGSPASLFLLLKRATLVPRRGRKTVDDSAADADEIVGDAGLYGCPAATNVYNIIHPQDPICYQCNATIDNAYAATLKQPTLPSTASSWLSFGNPFKASSSKSDYVGASRPALTARLPSTVEMETHNFSREEIAEKRAFLLNDNGQIDFYMRGGGPLEFQYLTMLSAHSSYWLSKDVSRFVVIETGRRPGREGTLEALRAVKKKQSIRPTAIRAESSR